MATPSLGYIMRKLIEGTYVSSNPEGFGDETVSRIIKEALEPIKGKIKKLLLIPPDFTRLHSNSGLITSVIYSELSPKTKVDVLPALGTHVPMSEEEWNTMYKGVPYSAMLEHDWRHGIVRLGEVPGEYVSELSGGIMDSPIPVELNERILDKSYDLILSVGQVVPHEVVGMANQSKNLFVGCGGAGMINSSHMLGAFCGIEDIMGKDKTAVRAVFDYAQENFIADLPLQYILTVTDAPLGDIRTHGLFIGRDRYFFEEAVKLAQEKNVIKLDSPIETAVVLLDEQEFQSTWLGNKAVYRTRKAIADGGKLIVLAPGVKRFGEDKAVDELIRKYGYKGRQYVIDMINEKEDLRANLSAAAHLIHGSSDGRFSITYCTRHLSKEEIEQVGYDYMPLDDALKKYAFDSLEPGYNTLPSGEKIYYINNPALGLWMV